MAEQYFSAEPASKDVRRTLNVTLRGHEATAQVSNGVSPARAWTSVRRYC